MSGVRPRSCPERTRGNDLTGARVEPRGRVAGHGQREEGQGEHRDATHVRSYAPERRPGPRDLSTVEGRRLRKVFDALFAALALVGGHDATLPVQLIGRSALGRPIRAFAYGRPDAERTVLVVGCIHGDEGEGIEITRRLQGTYTRAARVVIVHQLNPDGYRLGVRQNGRGVDLNRNFGSEWIPIGQRWDPQYSGPRPWSEPETRIARALIRRIRPDITIWYHQPQALVRAWGQSRPVARRYARLARVPYRSIRWPNGTAPNWQNHRFPGTTSFVVELPPGELPDAAAARHARAVVRLAQTG
jgi:protein MpaA